MPSATKEDGSGLQTKRFEREARAVAALNHPNICTIYDVGLGGASEAPFIAMEMLDGQTLQQRLVPGPLDMPTLVDLAIALADVLDAAPRAGIIHRDIKPANVFLTARGPKMLDFGFAPESTTWHFRPWRESVATTPSRKPTLNAARSSFW